MKKLQCFSSVFTAFLLSAELWFLSDIILYQRGIQSIPFSDALLIFAAFFAVSLLLERKCRKPVRFISGSLLVAFLALVAAEAVFSATARYASLPADKDALFADRKVMLIVPHEDDDINVLGGVIEQYTAYGSEIYVVFVTNGDASGLGPLRIREAINCMEYCGVPEDHVIFLGYGDQWLDGYHIYCTEPDTVLLSRIGRDATYGIESHPPFRTHSYTSAHFFSDMEQVILNHTPDTIFCVDFDNHIDHQAVSLCFEKTMGKILREHSDYRPAVLKGYAYSTAWEAWKDFWKTNLPSTREPDDELAGGIPLYLWEARLRLPVKSAGLSRSLLSTDVFREFSFYGSQNPALFAARVCNSDKVFWQRFTDSQTYHAAVKASSGNPECINDFMLYDFSVLKYDRVKGLCGVWIPEESDAQKSVTLTFPQEISVETIRLYDNPSSEHNIVEAQISLDTGETIAVGRLEPSGAPTDITVPPTKVQSITITILQAEGDSAGLTEVEVYEKTPASSFSMVKLMDPDGNFAYDYLAEGNSEFYVYTSGDAPIFCEENYQVSASNPNCTAQIVGDCVRLTCPRGNRCMVSISSMDGRYSDSIYVENRLNFVRAAQLMERGIERYMLDSNTYRYFCFARSWVRFKYHSIISP